MKWVQSNGGPLVLVPESRIALWRGIDQDLGMRKSHYDLACSITEELGVLVIGDVEVLVLGDEPLQTTWLPRHTGGLLVRWIYGDSDRAVTDFLTDERQDDIYRHSSGLTFTTPGSCLLFDSADPGDDIRSEHLHISLAQGSHMVTTTFVNPSVNMKLMIHKFAPKSDLP